MAMAKASTMSEVGTPRAGCIGMVALGRASFILANISELPVLQAKDEVAVHMVERNVWRGHSISA